MSVSLPATGQSLSKDVEYGRAASASLRLDASIPPGPGPHPAVIVVHGGGWVAGDRRTNVEPLFAPLMRAGLAWFSISYRLAGDISQFGQAIDDVQQAIRYVQTHAAEYRVDANRLALVGESAGGQLAAMAALRSAPGTVKGVVALYTPTDLVSLAKTSSYVPASLRDSVRGTPWEALILAGLAQLSPLDNVRGDMPPFLFIHGTADILVPFSQSQTMCARMKAVGAACEVYPVPGGGHGILWWRSAGLGAGYQQKMAAWLRDRLDVAQPPAVAGQPDGIMAGTR